MDASLIADLLVLAPALAVAGAITGVLAGLFGVGGGAIIVPVLYELFRFLDVPDHLIMPLAVGTSLAVIIPTSVRSYRGHRRAGAVDKTVLRTWALPVLIGVLVGAVIARYADPWVFKLAFVLVASVNAIKLLFGRESWKISDQLPGRGTMSAYGGVVGLLSSLMGIGGGAMSNMMLTLHGFDIRRAVATSAGLGVIISVPGAIGYMIAGWPQMDALPPFSIGYVSLIGVAALVPMTILTTPIGVKLAHSIPKRTLEIAFGLFLATVAARFIWSLFTGL